MPDDVVEHGLGREQQAPVEAHRAVASSWPSACAGCGSSAPSTSVPARAQAALQPRSRSPSRAPAGTTARAPASRSDPAGTSSTSPRRCHPLCARARPAVRAASPEVRHRVARGPRPRARAASSSATRRSIHGAKLADRGRRLALGGAAPRRSTDLRPLPPRAASTVTRTRRARSDAAPVVDPVPRHRQGTVRFRRHNVQELPHELVSPLTEPLTDGTVALRDYVGARHPGDPDRLPGRSRAPRPARRGSAAERRRARPGMRVSRGNAGEGAVRSDDPRARIRHLSGPVLVQRSTGHQRAEIGIWLAPDQRPRARVRGAAAGRLMAAQPRRARPHGTAIEPSNHAMMLAAQRPDSRRGLLRSYERDREAGAATTSSRCRSCLRPWVACAMPRLARQAPPGRPLAIRGLCQRRAPGARHRLPGVRGRAPVRARAGQPEARLRPGSSASGGSGPTSATTRSTSATRSTAAPVAHALAITPPPAH